MRLLAFILGVVLGAGVAVAQQIDPGAPVGAERTLQLDRDFDSYALPIGPIRPGGIGTETVQGQVAWSAFRLDDETVSTSAVISGYRARLHGQGFETIFECQGETCGGFDFRFGASVLPPPAMLLDVRDFAQLSVQRAEPAGYASILVSRVQGRVFVQTVAVVPKQAPAEVTDAPSAPAPGTAQDGPVLLPQDERALLEQLQRDGHVPVNGLSFDTGGATLSEGSREALDLLAQMLTRDSELSVAIVGHSDNVGALDANIALSRRRAESVMRALIERGVVASQLEARGVGYLAPVTSNATPEGREINRRVELVLR